MQVRKASKGICYDDQAENIEQELKTRWKAPEKYSNKPDTKNDNTNRGYCGNMKLKKAEFCECGIGKGPKSGPDEKTACTGDDNIPRDFVTCEDGSKPEMWSAHGFITTRGMACSPSDAPKRVTFTSVTKFEHEPKPRLQWTGWSDQGKCNSLNSAYCTCGGGFEPKGGSDGKHYCVNGSSVKNEVSCANGHTPKAWQGGFMNVSKGWFCD